MPFLILLAYLAQGQGKLEFEVASVKISEASGPSVRLLSRGGPGTSDSTRMTMENYPLSVLVMRAYDLAPFQLPGLSELGGGRYNIDVKIPAGTTREQFLVMFQNLLIERFKMKLHHETKEMPLFELTLGKGGPKFKEHEGELPVDQGNSRLAPGQPNSWSLSLQSEKGFGRGQFNAVNRSMSEFSTDLSRQLRRHVVDATGLNGRYDFLLEWTWAPDPAAADAGPASAGPGGGPPPPPPPPDKPATVEIVKGLQKLGLRLESKKGPVDLIVVDHVEKVPTEN